MADYARLYRHMFNAATDAVELLKKAQLDAESLYVDSPDPEVQLFPGGTVPGEDDNGEE